MPLHPTPVRLLYGTSWPRRTDVRLRCCGSEVRHHLLMREVPRNASAREAGPDDVQDAPDDLHHAACSQRIRGLLLLLREDPGAPPRFVQPTARHVLRPVIDLEPTGRYEDCGEHGRRENRREEDEHEADDREDRLDDRLSATLGLDLVDHLVAHRRCGMRKLLRDDRTELGILDVPLCDAPLEVLVHSLSRANRFERPSLDLLRRGHVHRREDPFRDHAVPLRPQGIEDRTDLLRGSHRDGALWAEDHGWCLGRRSIATQLVLGNRHHTSGRWRCNGRDVACGRRTWGRGGGSHGARRQCTTGWLVRARGRDEVRELRHLHRSARTTEHLRMRRFPGGDGLALVTILTAALDLSGDHALVERPSGRVARGCPVLEELLTARLRREIEVS